MGFLAGKHILITGLPSNRLIAYGIVSVCKRGGVKLALTYVDERFKDRITKFAAESDSELVLDYDVSSDEQIAKVLEDLGQHWGHFDGLVHSIDLAPCEAIAGSFTDGLPRESFRIVHDISVYSFLALAEAALLMLPPTASLLALTYLGAERTVPNYNTMGLVKASLETGTRYLAGALGPKGIRASGILAGLIKVLVASGVEDFDKLLKYMEDVAPPRRNVTIGEAGNVAAFLLSDLASGVTGEIAYIDYGFNVTTGVPEDVGQN